MKLPRRRTRKGHLVAITIVRRQVLDLAVPSAEVVAGPQRSVTTPLRCTTSAISSYDGNISFAVPGVKKSTLLLGPCFTLYVPCPSDIELLQEDHDGDSCWRFGGSLVKAVDGGDPFELAPENVERENLRQVSLCRPVDLLSHRGLPTRPGAYSVRSRGIRSGPLRTVS